MITIRVALPEDCVAIAELHKRAICETNRPFYTKEEIASWSNVTPEGHQRSLGNGYKVVAEDERGILGFGHAVDQEIRGLYVDPRFQKCGVGKALLLNLEDELRASGVKEAVLDSSRAARAFYEHNGYVVVTERDTLVRGCAVPGFLMRKQL